MLALKIDVESVVTFEKAITIVLTFFLGLPLVQPLRPTPCIKYAKVSKLLYIIERSKVRGNERMNEH